MKNIRFSQWPSFFLGPVLLFLPFLLGYKTVGGVDFTETYSVWAKFIKSELSQGHFPLWNPYAMMGHPTWGEVENAFFYPLKWLLYLHADGFISWFLVLHLGIIHIGVFRVCKALGQKDLSSWLAGFVFTYCGWVSSHIYANHTFMLACITWLPHILAECISFSEEHPQMFKKWLGLSLQWTFLLNSGSPQMAYYSMFGIFLYLLLEGLLKNDWKRLFFCASALLPAMCIFFPTWLATSELHSQSHRDGAWPQEYMLWAAFPLKLWTQFIVPPSVDWISKRSITVYECGVFLGVAPLLFAIVGAVKQKKASLVWLCMMFLFFALAIGKPPFLLELFRKLPSASFFRVPSRFLVWDMLILAIFCGFGLDCLYETLKKHKSQWVFPIQFIFSTLIIIPLFFNVINYVPDKSAEDPQQLPAIVSKIKQKQMPERTRILVDRELFPSNALWEHKIEIPTGRNPLFLKRYIHYFDNTPRNDFSKVLAVKSFEVENSPWMNRLSPEYLFTVTPYKIDPSKPPTLEDFQFPYYLQKNTNAWPKVRFFGTAKALSSYSDAREKLHENSFEDTLWYEGPEFHDSLPAVGNCTYRHVNTDEWKISCSSDGPGFVWISQAFYPGWKAEVNGEPAEIFPAHLLFQTFRIPQGKSEIRLYYRPRAIIVLTLCSFVVFLTLVGFYLWQLRIFRNRSMPVLHSRSESAEINSEI